MSGVAQRNDLDELWRVMLDVGAEPFRTSDRRTVESRYRSVRDGLGEPLTAAAFALRVAPVFATLNDGHAGILPPTKFRQAIAVPVRLELEGDDLVVVASTGNVVPPGSRLVSLGGISAARLRDLTLETFGAQTKALQRAFLGFRARTVIAALTDNPVRYAVRWGGPYEKSRKAILPAVAPSLGANEKKTPYAYRTLQDGHVGFIDYRRCDNLPDFNHFLETTFRSVREGRVRGLVIDIRNNGGGDSSLNDALW